MKSILVSGSTAFDYIMDYKDKFQNHIMPDKIHMLNVAFIIDKLEKSNWWTGSNISYSISLLWEKPILFSSVGSDFIVSEDLKKKINYNYIYKTNEVLTASAYITTDLDDNQIIAFYPGAMNYAEKMSILDIKEDISYAIAAPNNQKAMIKFIKECSEQKIKSFFDPGQQLSILSKEELLEASKYANYLIVNDYEFQQFINKSWLSKEHLIKKFEKIIITLGKKWAQIIDKNWKLIIPTVKTDNVIDPTGAGDSFRAGLLKWLHLWYDWEISAKIWALSAHYCIQSYGTQKHKFTISEFENKFVKEFDMTIKLVK